MRREGFVVGFDAAEKLTLDRWLAQGGRARAGLVERVANRSATAFRPDPRLGDLEDDYRRMLARVGRRDGDLTRQELGRFVDSWRASRSPLTARELTRLAFPDDD